MVELCRSSLAHVEADNERYLRLRWFGLSAISLSVALIIMDSTIVAVAVPAIINDLGLSTTQVQWIQEIYTLVFAALLLVWGRVADGVGRRRILALGLLIFLAGSALCALAPSGGWLICARAVQGIGGSMILPATLSLLNATFRGKERTIAFAVWGSTIGGMAAVGPIVGGWLTSSYSWNWAFLINVPLGLIAAGGVLYFVAGSRESATVKLDDYLGALLSVVGFGSLAFGLIEGRHYGWWGATTDAPFSVFGFSPAPVAFVLSVLALGGFILLERSRSQAKRSVLLDLSLFNISSFSRGNLTALTVSLGEFGLILSLPLWFQNVLGLNALQAGGVGAVGRGILRGFRVDIRAVQVAARGAHGAAGCWTGDCFGGNPGPVDPPRFLHLMTSAILLVYGIGVGFATAQLTQVVLAGVPVQQSGQAASTQSTARQVGSALGIAILGTALFTTLKNSTESQVSGLVAQFPQLKDAVDSVTHSSGGTISALAGNPQTAAIADAARNALTQGVSVAAWIAAGALALGLLTSLRLRPAVPPPEEPQAAEAAGEK